MNTHFGRLGLGSLVCLAISLSLTACSGASGDGVTASPEANAGPAVPGTNLPGATDDGVASDGKDITSEAGKPRINEFRFFGRPEGFPTYKAHLVSSLSHLFQKITVENPTSKEALVEVKGALQGFTKGEGSVTLTLAPGEKRDLTLDPTLDYEALDKVSSPVPAAFTVSLTFDGKVVSSGSSATKVLPKNTVFWSQAGKTGFDATEISVTVAALTTPHDARQAVDTLLKEAATRSQFGSMLGYQYQGQLPADKHVAGAMDQLGAIYATLQERGMNYTSVGTAFFSGAQNVRYPAESLAIDSANCIDGALVFAAAAEALGMHPIVVVVPGHALLVVRAGEKGTPAYESLVPIETTVVSSKTFQESVNLGLAKIKSTPKDKIITVDIEKLRAAKVTPSPFPM